MTNKKMVRLLSLKIKSDTWRSLSAEIEKESEKINSCFFKCHYCGAVGTRNNCTTAYMLGSKRIVAWHNRCYEEMHTKAQHIVLVDGVSE